MPGGADRCSRTFVWLLLLRGHVRCAAADDFLLAANLDRGLTLAEPLRQRRDRRTRRDSAPTARKKPLQRGAQAGEYLWVPGIRKHAAHEPLIATVMVEKCH